MKITIITLFPDMFVGPFSHSIVNRAINNKLVKIDFVDIRDHGIGKHKMVDDTEYGGGVGMIMKVDVLHSAIKKAYNQKTSKRTKVVLLSASGKTFNQKIAYTYSHLEHLILICGHYEGIDTRINKYIDEEISIGDFILTGGEIPAMLIADSVTRLIKNVLPTDATTDESFNMVNNQTLLEYPHYTNPRTYDKSTVPEILLTGNHKEIKKWRQKKALEITLKKRPDLLK